MQLASQPINHTLNASAVTSSAASLFGFLPPTLAAIASFLSIVWLLVQLYDNKRITQFREWIKKKICKTS